MYVCRYIGVCVHFRCQYIILSASLALSLSLVPLFMLTEAIRRKIYLFFIWVFFALRIHRVCRIHGSIIFLAFTLAHSYTLLPNLLHSPVSTFGVFFFFFQISFCCLWFLKFLLQMWKKMCNMCVCVPFSCLLLLFLFIMPSNDETNSDKKQHTYKMISLNGKGKKLFFFRFDLKTKTCYAAIAFFSLSL